MVSRRWFAGRSASGNSPPSPLAFRETSIHSFRIFVSERQRARTCAHAGGAEGQDERPLRRHGVGVLSQNRVRCSAAEPPGAPEVTSVTCVRARVSFPFRKQWALLKDPKQDFGGKNGSEKLTAGRPQTNSAVWAQGLVSRGGADAIFLTSISHTV